MRMQRMEYKAMLEKANEPKFKGEPGTPLRVAKHRRNKPCHCGSGKKFKNCCL